jgi:pyruvate dehydrogenase E1 component alpha subunit
MKEVTKEVYLKWYEDMLLGESLRTNLALYIQQKVRILHLYNGQEAVLAGALHAMDLTKDKMITAYRNHVQPIGMGVDPKRVAELLEKLPELQKVWVVLCIFF